MSTTVVVAAATGALIVAQGLPAPDGIELSGSWAARNFTDAIGNMPGGGPRPVDYMGIPLNDTGRAWSLIYSQSQVSMPERICDYYAPTYIAIGPMGSPSGGLQKASATKHSIPARYSMTVP